VSGRRSIRADKTPPRKIKEKVQMIDVKGFPLRSEVGPPLVTEKDSFNRPDYEASNAPSVVVDSKSYRTEGFSTGNKFSRGAPAALPIIEQFPEQSEVSRSLLGIDRQTSQKGLFSNVSSYGLDAKDWEFEVSGYRDGRNRWWTRRPSASGNYSPAVLVEDDKNAAIRLTSNPTPFLEPTLPTANSNFGVVASTRWGQYLNTIVALYIFKYMVKNFSQEEKLRYNLTNLLNLYSPTLDPEGNEIFDEIYWDKIWLDISQARFGSSGDNYPLIPSLVAYNFLNVQLDNFRSASLWGISNDVIITEANSILPASANFSWNSDYFSSSRIFFPLDRPDNKGHFKFKTNPDASVWSKYFGLRWESMKPEIKDWEFTVHESEDTVTQIEKDLKLPYIIIDKDSPSSIFSASWPSAAATGLPVNGNRIGGNQGIDAGITLKSTRAFRYQPGRISGFTYGVKLSEVGAGPGTTVEFGIENKTDSYMFRLTDGSNFSIIRRSIIPLDRTIFLENAKYSENTKTVIVDNEIQYETTIGQNIMNGDPLSGEGKSGYILDPDTVTMYKIEFGWYGAIGARFYAYVPVGNNECRWVTLHTLVIENQLRQPCLGDPFFFFTYKLNIKDSSSVRVDQFVEKFGASYYIDGYDDGNVSPLSVSSGSRELPPLENQSTVNPIDWITLIGLKPRQFLTNVAGEQIFNKKEIYPEKLYVNSQTDCEIKIIRQRGCPEFAYNHQEGYRWGILPESRRMRARFAITPLFELNAPDLGIDQKNASTHTAIAAYSTSAVGGFRDPRIQSNWQVIGNQSARLLGNDLFSVFTDLQSFEGGSLAMRLKRPNPYRYVSSRQPVPQPIKNVALPFTYAPVAPNEEGYNVEIDYFRRDQILLSSIDVNSNEFYIYFTGGSSPGPNPGNFGSVRFGFVWPDQSNPSSPLYADVSSPDWGVENDVEYDGQKFYEGLPYDFVEDYENNCLYVETGSDWWYNTFGLEIQEEDFFLRRFLNLDPDYRLNVSGVEGGTCRGLFCKSGRELREKVVIISEFDEITETTTYYVSDPSAPWPNLAPKTYSVTVSQGGVIATVETTGGIVKVIDGITFYLIPIGNQLPEGVETGFADVYYNIVYIARLNEKSEAVEILTSEIAPGEIPFIRVFVQARQGVRLGGIWIGQKTPAGVRVEPFTPHRSSVSISDTGTDYHSQWSSDPQPDGAVKAISTFTQPGTSPTFNASEENLNTFKSIHTNPRKCGNFLAPNSQSSAGVFVGSEYPLRWFTQPGMGTGITTYYVSANTPTQIDLKGVFNVFGESVLNSSFSNIATFIVGKALSEPGEIFTSINYVEQ
jgi:hypothetical protein